jgi:hypothetical protein
LGHLNNLDELAKKFFHLFCRVEYAQNVAGFNNGNGPAEANWRNFALAIEAIIEQPTSPDLIDAIDFLFTAPPNK